MKNTNNKIFEDLFVLEMTNNHLGSLERGIKIIDQFLNYNLETLMNLFTKII